MTMKGAERYEGLYHESIPVIPLVGIHSAQIAAVDIHRALADGTMMAEAALSALDQYGYDGVLPFMDLTLEAEALGCEVQYHQETVPSIKKVLSRDLESHDLIRISSIEESPRVSEYLRAVEILRERTDPSKTLVGSYATGPFTLAGQIMGMETIFEGMILTPDLFHAVLKKTLVITTEVVGFFAEQGADMVIILDPMASPDLISPSHFDLFARPYLEKTVAQNDKDVLLVLHICGDTTNILSPMVQCGFDGISIDSKVDMGYAAQILGDNGILMGNVDPVSTLLNGTPDDVYQESVACIEDSSEAQYFVLSSGCEVPKNTSQRNIREMVTVARQYGIDRRKK
jgi:uroporphyrinogen decarboxylase